MIKCSECKEEATYLHPRRYCDEHWARWWSDIGQTSEEKEQIYQEAMQFMKETFLKEQTIVKLSEPLSLFEKIVQWFKTKLTLVISNV
jgi:hypothetical protein